MTILDCLDNRSSTHVTLLIREGSHHWSKKLKILSEIKQTEEINFMPKHLAIVDDENDFCEIIIEVATEIGYRVSTFNVAREFLQSLDQDPCDCLILDILMPDMDGIEVIRHLSQREEPIEIILCSGYSDNYLNMAETLGSASGVNVVKTMNKPVRISDLEKILKIINS